MTHPFPGIDPYVESQLPWQDFHTGFLTYMRDMINERLPVRYHARIEGQFSIVSSLGDERAYRGDVLVTFDPLRVSPAATAGAATLTMEPAIVPLATGLVEEEIADRWIEVRRIDDRALVAVIEVLSPANKIQPGRTKYIEKRAALIGQPVHLIELDFLLGGRRLPMGRALPPGDFYAFVSRAGRRPDSEVYAWSVRRALPTIPIPLAPPDPDLPLDLGALYRTAYEKGRYAGEIRRDLPLGLPLHPDDLAWIADLGRDR